MDVFYVSSLPALSVLLKFILTFHLHLPLVRVNRRSRQSISGRERDASLRIPFASKPSGTAGAPTARRRNRSGDDGFRRTSPLLLLANVYQTMSNATDVTGPAVIWEDEDPDTLLTKPRPPRTPQGRWQARKEQR